MKTLFLSDIHNQKPVKTIKRLKKLFKKESPDKLVFLGDVDFPEIFEWILNLNINKRIVVGNHEYAWCWGIEVFSPHLQHPALEYLSRWKKSELTKIVLEAAERKEGNFARITSEQIKGKTVIYSHCPIVWGKSLITEDCYRLSRGIIKDAFRQMQKQDWWAWFKGHDHLSQVYSLKREKDPYKTKFKEESTNLTLNDSKRYIINVPAFIENMYATLDEETFQYQAKRAD